MDTSQGMETRGAMNYFTIEFYYPGPYDSIPGFNREADNRNGEAEKDAYELLMVAGYDARHEYSWPDGSLYLVIRTEDEYKTVVGNLRDRKLRLVEVSGVTDNKGSKYINGMYSSVEERFQVTGVAEVLDLLISIVEGVRILTAEHEAWIQGL